MFAVTTAVALSTALFGVRATDTGFTAFLCLIQIIQDTGYDTKEYNNDYCIFHNYLLSAAVSGRTRQCDVAYDIPALNQHLDFINVMLYDGTGLWNGVAAHNAPLYEASRVAVDYWISKGADKEKIIFGLPLYGYTFKLADGSKHNLGDAVAGDGHIGGNYGNVRQWRASGKTHLSIARC